MIGRTARRLRWFARWFGGLLLVLVLAELAVRLVGVAPPPPKIYRDALYLPDPHLPYRQAPLISRRERSGSGEFIEEFSHNSAGYRDVEHARDKPPGSYRILGVGGSIAYGSGVPFNQTYLALLERELNETLHGTPAVEVIKAGVGGFFPQAERLLVEHEGLAYHPDLLLVQFDGTDIRETLLGLDEARVFDGFLKTAEMRELGYAGTFLAVRTHIGRILYRWWSARRRHRLEERLRGREPEAWRRIGEEYDAMRDLTARQGGRMAVLFIPLSIQPPDPQGGPLADYCRARGLLLVDATPALVEASREGPVYWEKDRHATPLAHRAIARALAQALAGSGYLR